MDQEDYMIRVACIEDDSHFARMAESVIRMQPDITCLLSAPNVEDFWKNIPKRANLEILFVDIELPGQSGVDAVPALRKRFPQADIIMLSHLEDDDLLLRALHYGATGYLNKDFPLLQLPQFIQIIRKGGALISPKMARKLVQHLNPPEPSSLPTAQILSAKESQVLQLFNIGYSYEEAASAMGISVDGVRYYVRNIYGKLNVDNKIDAIRVFKTQHKSWVC